ncbi:CsgE family curli-type amyloid fiber assembly protein [Rhodohalobacter sp. 8-1]|uniref:CsgE family curli-type amyloid fiber assembly protein n=1 Tax=Rhodohalobacter sp. 8-1 TaxID=3131972 RepID=UPI0030EBF4E8
MSINKIVHIALFTILLGSSVATTADPDEAISHCSDQDIIHTVKDGDSLYDISKRFGSTLFWESLYVANADIVNNPDMIYPGQKIKVPFNVANYRGSEIELDQVVQNPFCRISELPYREVEEKYLSQYTVPFLESVANTERSRDRKDLERKAQRESVADAVGEKTGAETNQAEQNNRGTIQRESERQLMIEIDGMVHDDTRSKVGRDFYNVFYSYWQSPENAHNFNIRVSEQPSPNLGTTIYVTVNYTETFRMRLQPRYEMIEEAGKYAVRQTFAYLQNNYQETIIY